MNNIDCFWQELVVVKQQIKLKLFIKNLILNNENIENVQIMTMKRIEEKSLQYRQQKLTPKPTRSPKKSPRGLATDGSSRALDPNAIDEIKESK